MKDITRLSIPMDPALLELSEAERRDLARDWVAEFKTTGVCRVCDKRLDGRGIWLHMYKHLRIKPDAGKECDPKPVIKTIKKAAPVSIGTPHESDRNLCIRYIWAREGLDASETLLQMRCCALCKQTLPATELLDHVLEHVGLPRDHYDIFKSDVITDANVSPFELPGTLLRRLGDCGPQELTIRFIFQTMRSNAPPPVLNDRNTIKCTRCSDFSTMNNNKLSVHMLQVHGTSIHVCHACKKNFETYKLYVRHKCKG